MQCITADEVVNALAGEELVGVDLGGGSPPTIQNSIRGKGEGGGGEREKKRKRERKGGDGGRRKREPQ